MTQVMDEIFSAFAAEDDEREEKEAELSAMQARTKICRIHDTSKMTMHMLEHHFDVWAKNLVVYDKTSDNYTYFKSRLNHDSTTKNEFMQTRDGVSYDVKKDIFAETSDNFLETSGVNINLSSILPECIIRSFEGMLSDISCEFYKEEAFPPGALDELEKLGYVIDRVTIATRFIE